MKMTSTLKDSAKEETGGINMKKIIYILDEAHRVENSPLRQALALDTEKNFVEYGVDQASDTGRED
jgi:hypothetical protein